jgi:hypothetical protein
MRAGRHPGALLARREGGEKDAGGRRAERSVVAFGSPVFVPADSFGAVIRKSNQSDTRRSLTAQTVSARPSATNLPTESYSESLTRVSVSVPRKRPLADA